MELLILYEEFQTALQKLLLLVSKGFQLSQEGTTYSLGMRYNGYEFGIGEDATFGDFLKEVINFSKYNFVLVFKCCTCY